MQLNVISLLRSWRQRSPEQEAVCSYDVAASKRDGAPVLSGRLTVAELWDQVTAFGAALQKLGVGAGDVLALQVPNWHQSYVTYLAATAIGAVVMPISTIYRGRDLSRQLAIGGATTMFVPARLGKREYVHEALDLASAGGIPLFRQVIAIGQTGDTEGALIWEELLEAGNAPELAGARAAIGAGEFVRGPDDLLLLNFTSGTTGEPKGVMHTARTILSSARALIERLELTSEDRFFVPTTLGHAAGFLNGLYVPLALGTTTIYMDSWDAGTALRVIEDERVTYGPAMPTYLMDILDHSDFSQRDISSWTRVRVSGGAIPRQVIAELQHRMPGLRLCPGWGMSEVLYGTCGSPDDPAEKLATSDGRPLLSAEIRVLGPAGESVPTGSVGEIAVRGPSVTPGYYGRENLTQQALTADGWFRSGDLGFLDEDGFLTIAGRSKELVIRGGENVPVVEVEHLLNGHPRIRQAAVIGLPDRRLGERVCAVLELVDPGEQLTVEEIREYLDEAGLTRQFIPEYVETVDELPRTSLGKLRKFALKEKILARRELERSEALPQTNHTTMGEK